MRVLFQLTAPSPAHLWVLCFIAFVVFCGRPVASADSEPVDVLVVVGPSSHPPGTHEVAAGGRLIQHLVNHTPGYEHVRATLTHYWPNDQSLLQRVDTVVFLGDQFPPHQMPQSERIMQQLTTMMDRGCGIVCLHFATGLRSPNVPPDGDHPLLRWMGGYFASRCEHHKSVARIFPSATIEPADQENMADHPVMRGWNTFELHDEPYIENYFGPDNQMLDTGTIAFATSQLPPESPSTQIVSWGRERPDGGRGFAVVMPHFYRNWANDDLRTLIFNGIFWTAHQAIPAGGIPQPDFELNQFQPEQPVWPADPDVHSQLATYFADQVHRLESQNDLRQFQSLDTWQAVAETKREQLAEMLGLRPAPPRTPLDAKVTGTFEADGIVVENLHYQASPGLYVTANLYRPADTSEPLPAVLYVCGHANQQETIDGKRVSYGNKTGYQRHGAWLASHGYVCLMIDTIQLGEFMGQHHGTHRDGRWDWFSTGYTPAGVEAWNGIRGIDYLISRPEVDPDRIAVTGRSGGGAYSWFVAALDQRVAAAVPVAGITDLRNHVIDRCVTGHCDCMFFVNYYQWDYATLAALIAPRPLLLANSDRDTIFPLDGVTRVAGQVQHIYDLYDASEAFGTAITPGPHKDTYELQVAAYRWLNHHLRKTDDPIAETFVDRFDRRRLKVFDTLPDDQRVTTADALFAERLSLADHPAKKPSSEDDVEQLRNLLATRAFSGWPTRPQPLAPRVLWQQTRNNTNFELWEFQSQTGVALRALVTRPQAQPASPSPASDGASASPIVRIVDDAGWDQVCALAKTGKAGAELAVAPDRLTVFVAPRGRGPLRWRGENRERTHWRRSYYLIGQTEAAMQAWDVLRAVRFARTLTDRNQPAVVTAAPQLAAPVIYAAAMRPNAFRIQQVALPNDYLGKSPLLGAARIAGLDAFLNDVAQQASQP